MEVLNCPKCGKVFQRYNDPICDSCMKDEEDLFQSVRKFLIDNPDCKVEEVTKATGASVKKIMRYLKEGRLEISKGMHGSLRCEQCNKPIDSGKYCEKCIIEIGQAVEDLFGNPSKTKENVNKGPRMHMKPQK